MQYELLLLYRTVAGDLSPAFSGPSHYARHLAYLGEREWDRAKQYRVQFRKTGAAYQLLGYENYYAGRFEDLALPEGEQLADKDLQTQLLHQALPVCRLSPEQVIHQSLYRENDHLTLYLHVQSGLHQLTPEEAAFQYYKQLVAEEVARIQADLLQGAFTQPTEEATRQYVRNHQYGLLVLARLLHEKLPGGKRIDNSFTPDNWIAATCQMVYQQVKRLYQFVEAHFAPYVSHTVPLPAWYQVAPAAERVRIELVKQFLLESKLDVSLVRIVLEPLDQLEQGLDDRDNAFTLQKLTYLRRLLEELEQYRQVAGDQARDDTLIRLLTTLNFNHLRFFNYLAGKLQEQAAGEDEPLEELYYQLKVYKQSPSFNGLIYTPHYPPLRDQVIYWLEEEIRFREKKQHLKETAGRAKEPVEGELKIQTDLSVAELGFLTRALYDTQVFTNPQQKDILRVMSRSFSSVRQERISLQSLRAKYYDAEDTTRLRIKALAQRLIRYVEKGT